MASSVYLDGRKFEEYKFNREEEFEDKIAESSRFFFGSNSIYIYSKKKIDTKTLGSSIPDGFLFDLKDKDDPQFYLVEIELASHNFYRHIFPQITKFFAFFQNSDSRNDLIEKIFSIVNQDTGLKRQFKKFLGGREIYKFIKDTIENSQNILLILNDKKDELPEIFQTYTDTWDKMVRDIYIKEFRNNNDSIYYINPDFEDIEKEEPKKISTEYTEEFHLEEISEPLKNVYQTIKNELLTFNKSIRFNPQKYYISIIYKKNYAYLKFRKKKIKIVIMMAENDVRNKIKHYKIKTLSEGVQKFYGGACCQIILENDKNLDEVTELLKEPVRRMRKGKSK